jgi:hypothetical protein
MHLTRVPNYVATAEAWKNNPGRPNKWHQLDAFTTIISFALSKLLDQGVFMSRQGIAIRWLMIATTANIAAWGALLSTFLINRREEFGQPDLEAGLGGLCAHISGWIALIACAGVISRRDDLVRGQRSQLRIVAIHFGLLIATVLGSVPVGLPILITIGFREG